MVKTERRPNTATLTKPTLLDTKLLGIFDMSTVSREHLLAIKNLVHSTPRCKCKPTAKTLSLRCAAEVCEAKPSLPKPEPKIPNMYKILNRTYRIRTNVRQRLHELSAAAAAAAAAAATEPVDGSLLNAVPVIPSPCITCGRPEQPERFHSHPSRVERVAKSNLKLETTTTPEPIKRKTVQKPVAMKFRSTQTKHLDAIKEKELADAATTMATTSPSRLQKPSSKEIKSPKKTKAPPPPVSSAAASVPDPAQQPKSSPDKDNVTAKPKIKLCSRWRNAIKKSIQPRRESKMAEKMAKQQSSPKGATTDLRLSDNEGGYKLATWNPAPVSGGRTRKAVCYLCSQEFGTAALPSHEAQCIQKYLKETADNDNALKNSEEKKEQCVAATTQENWKLAWEITQASLIPCEFCDRKFLPTRLEAHEKICGSKVNKESLSQNRALTNANIPQPGVLCENCGKRYGSSSIVIHREQCVKKLKNIDQQLVEPTPQSPRKLSQPVAIICYICGRNFGTKSIGFHEPQCLKKWKMENDKLPPELQRPDPIKFEQCVYQGSDDIDSASQELFWRAHKAQLVPCPKCARTFYPDRLEVHLKGCKGPSKNKVK